MGVSLSRGTPPRTPKGFPKTDTPIFELRQTKYEAESEPIFFVPAVPQPSASVLHPARPMFAFREAPEGPELRPG